MPVLSEGDTCYSPEICEDNPEYYKIHDEICDNLLKKKIKSFTVGFDYHYITFKGDIKVKVNEHKLHGQTYLRVFDDVGTKIDMNPMQWNDIIIRKKGTIEIETQSGGIYIEFL